MGHKSEIHTHSDEVRNTIRRDEVCQLLVEDVKEENDVPFFEIRTLGDAGEERKSLKTEASARRVPIHQELLKMGFLDQYCLSSRERISVRTRWEFYRPMTSVCGGCCSSL